MTEEELEEYIVGTDITELVLRVIQERVQFFQFKKEAQKLEYRFPKFKVIYKKMTVDPHLACSIKDCPHLSILDFFEKEPIDFWSESNPAAVEHPYWQRLKKYQEVWWDKVSPEQQRKHTKKIENKCRGFFTLYHHIKNFGFNEDLLHQAPPFLCDVDGLPIPPEHKIIRKAESTELESYGDRERRQAKKKRMSEQIVWHENGNTYSARGYFRQDGHHRTDIAKFLKIPLPVIVAKFDFDYDKTKDKWYHS